MAAQASLQASNHNGGFNIITPEQFWWHFDWAWATYYILKRCHRPWNAFFKLFWPIPWKYTLPPQLPPTTLSAGHHSLLYLRQIDSRVIRPHPLFRLRDSPLLALYRLYEQVCAHHEAEQGDEVMYIWYRKEWSLHEFPDPKDADPARYTVLAAILLGLVHAFNWRLDTVREPRGEDFFAFRNSSQDERPRLSPTLYERAPAWTQVTRLTEELDLLPSMSAWERNFLTDATILERFNIRTTLAAFQFV